MEDNNIIRFASRMDQLPPYLFGMINKIKMEKRRNGDDVIDLGMGNPILTDDAVGVRLANDVGAALAGRADVTVVPECSVGGLNLLDHLEGFERAVVCDAIAESAAAKKQVDPKY